MKEIDPGHSYQLDVYDGRGTQHLVFMKREGPKYPGNVGSYSGTNCQEVIRALIARMKYLNQQNHCDDNEFVIMALRKILHAFERRAARRHGRAFNAPVDTIEEFEACHVCGQASCQGSTTVIT